MKQLSDHVYIFEDTCNVYIIKNEKTAVLIDFGSGAVLDRLDGIGVTAAAVLITHHHRDQVQGLNLAVERGIPIYVPHNEQDLISRADEHWQRREILNNYNNRQDRFSILHSVSISGTLKDYAELNFCEILFKIIPTPGHTTGSVSITADIDGRKLCFSGDLIYAPGKLWSLAATQWSYNGGEGIPCTVLSLLHLKEAGNDMLLPSHGEPMTADAIDLTVERLCALLALRRHNPRLLQLRDMPYEKITEHVLRNRTSMSDSYVLVSESGKAMIIDFGYDFIAGIASGTERSSRRPWLYTIPKLFESFGVSSIDACIPTHYHDDHVAGMNLLKQVYGASIICADTFSDILENPMDYDIPCLWYDPIEVDRHVPVNTSIKWEEYEITLHPLPGHTRYAVAVEFAADGKRFICGGDQYSDIDGLICNYVYKNKFAGCDFIASAELYNRISPDYMLTGHWGALEYTPEHGAALLERGRELSRQHAELLPYRDFGNSFLAEFKPYHASVRGGSSIDIEISVTCPFEDESDIELKMYMPPGFSFSGGLTAKVYPGGFAKFEISIDTPSEFAARERISCDVYINGKNYGQQAEMLISPKF